MGKANWQEKWLAKEKKGKVDEIIDFSKWRMQVYTLEQQNAWVNKKKH